MSLEFVNAFATVGSFLVISATAMAAIVQLRHMRSSNQIAAFNELRETTETPEFQQAHRALSRLPSLLNDPAFRYQIQDRRVRSDQTRDFLTSILRLGNFWETMGVFIKAGLIDHDIAMESRGGVVLQDWEALAPVTSILRRMQPDALLGFEYAAVLSQDWSAAHTSGAYPSKMRRLALADEWLEADRRYASSLAPA